MKKIMVVDDDKEILFTFKATLEDNNGYNVITANSGKKCFELLENKQIPDIIVLDILMPDMDGWEVQEKLRETPTYKNIPVIFMLTMEDKNCEIIKNVIENEFIEKPFHIKDLMDKIDKILKKK